MRPSVVLFPPHKIVFFQKMLKAFHQKGADPRLLKITDALPHNTD